MWTSLKPSASRMWILVKPRQLPILNSWGAVRAVTVKGQSLSGRPESVTPSR